MLVLALPCAGAAAPSNAATQAAQVYAQGVAAFKAANYKTALSRFERAYKLDPAPVLLYNIARCHEEMGNAKKSIEGFRLYLARQPDSPDRPDVERRIRVMEAILSRQAAAPPTAPPSAAPPSAPASVVSAAPPPEAPWQRPWGVGLTAAGALGVGMGIVFGISARDNEKAHQAADGDAEKSKRLDEAESDATAATVSFVAGGVLFAAGAGLLLWDLLGVDAPRVQVTPMPGGGAVGWSASF